MNDTLYARAKCAKIVANDICRDFYIYVQILLTNPGRMVRTTTKLIINF